MNVNSQYMLIEPDSGNIGYIDASFDGVDFKINTRVVEVPKPAVDEAPGELTELKILCPYCSHPYSARMETDFEYSMGSEWTGVYGEETKVKIYCDNCKKLVYTKDGDA